MRGINQEAAVKASTGNEIGPMRRRVRPAAIAGVALAAAALSAPSAASAGDAVLRFDQPGQQTFVAPEGVTQLGVRANGAKGGDGYNDATWHEAIGGFGDLIVGRVQVGTHRTFGLQVGVGGGAGDASETAGAGGGYSGFSFCPLTASSCAAFGRGSNSQLIVAAGGGGAGGAFGGGAGGASGAAGGAGRNGTEGFPLHLGNAGGGQPGTFQTGGAGGTSAPDAQFTAYPGTLGEGGASTAGGGGGGGGYYGGGAGGRGYSRNYEGPGGGGGGSSFTHQLAGNTTTTRSTDPKPWVEISYSETVAPHPTIEAPGYGDTVGQRPTFSGHAGTDTGDDNTVSVKVSSFSGGAERDFPATIDHSSGAWSVRLPGTRLEPGAYQANVWQADAAGNKSGAALVFLVEAPPVDPPADPPADPPVDPSEQQPQDQGGDPQPKDMPAATPGGQEQQAPEGPQPERQDQPLSQGQQEHQDQQQPMQRRAMLGLSARPQRLRTVLRKGFAATATCDSSCAVQIRLVLPAKVAKRYGLGQGRADVVVASGRTSAGGRPAKVVLRFSARTRKALAKARSLRLRLEASSADAPPFARTVTFR
jgi:hypothetical protein